MSTPTLDWRVVKVVVETADTQTFVLDADADVPSYRPGQFLTVRVPSEQGGTVARSYSFSSAPGVDSAPRITVKRIAGGYASNWLCDNLVPGARLQSLAPGGTFTPSDLNASLLLVAAGSGITPVMSILKASLAEGSANVALIYASRDENSVIFAEELRRLEVEYRPRLTVVHWLESLQGIPSDALSGHLARYARREAFVCGPAPFMELTERVLVQCGTPTELIRTERFVSIAGDPFDTSNPSGPSARVHATIDGTTHEVSWPTSRPLLDALLAAGVDAPYSCREGSCSACVCLLVEGEVSMVSNEILDVEDLAAGMILGCQARPVTEEVRVTYDG